MCIFVISAHLGAFTCGIRVDRCACASSQVEDVDALLAITQDVVNCLNRGLE